MKTFIKICGTTNLADALAATKAGADALGFVFAESSRRITPEAARQIITELPAHDGQGGNSDGKAQKIGVFVNEPVERVLEIAHAAALTGVQLHGDETPEYVQELRAAIAHLGMLLMVIKTVPAQAERFAGSPFPMGGEKLVDAVLVDSGSRAERGGTGKTFDWDGARELVAGLKQRTRVMIAGGLNPANVAAAITSFRPWGVDAVSGVERRPGVKDHEKLRAFVAAVRAAGSL